MTTETSDYLAFSNVTIVRDVEGGLSVWVDAVKMLGVGAVNIGNGIVSLALPLSRVRFAEDVPATPVVVAKDNIVPFNRFSGAGVAVTHTDGDSA